MTFKTGSVIEQRVLCVRISGVHCCTISQKSRFQSTFTVWKTDSRHYELEDKPFYIQGCKDRTTVLNLILVI